MQGCGWTGLFRGEALGWSHQVGLGVGRRFQEWGSELTAGMGPEEGQEVRGRLGCGVGVRAGCKAPESLLPWGQVTAIKTQFLLVRWRCCRDDLRSSCTWIIYPDSDGSPDLSGCLVS